MLSDSLGGWVFYIDFDIMIMCCDMYGTAGA